MAKKWNKFPWNNLEIMVRNLLFNSSVVIQNRTNNGNDSIRGIYVPWKL